MVFRAGNVSVFILSDPDLFQEDRFKFFSRKRSPLDKAIHSKLEIKVDQHFPKIKKQCFNPHGRILAITGLPERSKIPILKRQ
jgi:hypothetical protein